MASIISRRWTGEEQVALQQAVVNPEFQSFIVQNGFTLPQLQKWVRELDVPASFRASLRAAMNTWAHSRGAC